MGEGGSSLGGIKYKVRYEVIRGVPIALYCDLVPSMEEVEQGVGCLIGVLYIRY